MPTSSPSRRVLSVTCATAAIEASASPRNPMVWRRKRSPAWRIFDVAWRSNARRASVSDMPLPLSTTCRLVRPESTLTTLTAVAPASMEFSTSSLTTLAGRWMTSPAAIWLATESGNSCIISLIVFLYVLSLCVNVGCLKEAHAYGGGSRRERGEQHECPGEGHAAAAAPAACAAVGPVAERARRHLLGRRAAPQAVEHVAPLVAEPAGVVKAARTAIAEIHHNWLWFNGSLHKVTLFAPNAKAIAALFAP